MKFNKILSIVNNSLGLGGHTGRKQTGVSADFSLREGNMPEGRPGVITQLVYNFRRSVQASIVMMSALLMPVLIGMAGLGLDASNWMMTQRMLQNSVDAAVLAAAWETAHGMSDNMQNAAEREAANNGWDSTKDGTLVLTTDVDSDGQPVITGVLQQKADVYLSRMIHGSDIYIATKAAATLYNPTGDFCVLALSNAASSAIDFQGNSTFNASGCGLAVNSNSPSALTHTGGSYTVNLNDISVVGGSTMACNTGGLTCNSMATNSGSAADPYSNLDMPKPNTSCQSLSKVKSTVNLDTSSGSVFCGLDMSNGGTLNLAPGVYYFTGDMKVTGGTLNGTGVTIVMTSSDGVNYGQLDISGGTFNLTPPTSGDTAGVSVYVDRHAPTEQAGSGNSCKNSMLGNTNFNIQGAMYVPSQCLKFSGSTSGGSGAACSRIIANTIQFGSADIGNNCAGIPVKDIGQYTVKLTL